MTKGQLSVRRRGTMDLARELSVPKRSNSVSGLSSRYLLVAKTPQRNLAGSGRVWRVRLVQRSHLTGKSEQKSHCRRRSRKGSRCSRNRDPSEAFARAVVAERDQSFQGLRRL